MLVGMLLAGLIDCTSARAQQCFYWKDTTEGLASIQDAITYWQTASGCGENGQICFNLSLNDCAVAPTNGLAVCAWSFNYAAIGSTSYGGFIGGGHAELESGDVCKQFSVSTVVLPQSKCDSCDPVGHPISPETGNVYSVETDVSFLGASPIEFKRYYNSGDQSGADQVPGWRHSYDRNVVTVYQKPQVSYSGPTLTASPQYASASEACTSGFTTVQQSMNSWLTASASYSNGVCVISSSGGQEVATLPINISVVPPPSATPVEYDVIRDSGQILRYTLQNGSTPVTPPGISIRLAVTPTGFTVTDDDDNVETYNTAGQLQSITSRAGIVQTISYSNGRWSGVSDSFGNSISVTRNIEGGITTLNATGAGSVRYAYDARMRLTTVTNLDSTTRNYTYADSRFTNALTAEVDENGTQFSSWGYDSQERGTSTQEAGGAGAATLIYNSDGSVTVTDALGAVRTLSYTRVGDINHATSISGSPCFTCQDSAGTTFDSYGWVSSRTDYNGNLTCYTNDPVRGLERVRVEGFAPGSTCPSDLASYVPASGTLQRKITTTWSSQWREPSLITEANRTTAFTFDASGNILTKNVTDLTVSPTVSRAWTYTYNSFGQLLTSQSPRTDLSSTITYAYYGCTNGIQCGQVQTMTDELGHVTTFNTYNAYGQPLTITDPNAVVTTLTYDARERLASRSVAGETTSFSYYPTGLVKKVTLPDGSFIQYTYDAAHRLTGMTDGLGNQVVYTLDALGNRTGTRTYDPSNALSFTRTQVFNTLSELYQQVGSAGTSAVTTTFGYDSNGNQASINAPLSRSTANQYDALNRLIQITDPGTGVTQFHYDSDDNLISVVDPRSLGTTYAYNGFDDLIQQVSPDTGVTTNTVDSAGNLATSTDARHKTATYSYDARNRVTQIAYGDQTLTFGYDSGAFGVGRLTSAADANHALSWAYDSLGRVISKTQTVGSGASAVAKSVSYTYTNSDLTSLVTPSGQTVTYGYTNGQVTSLAINGNPLLSQVLYQPFGPVSGWTWANNTTEARVYNQDGNLTNLESAEGFTYSYDNAFRITGITDTDNGALSQSYGYDALDRLTSASGTGLNETWMYDANGNRVTQGGSSSSTYTVSAASNQISAISGALSRSYAYTASGQTSSYGGLTFTYMNSGRLSSVTNGAATTGYLFNVLGQRIEKSGTSVTQFVYDESGHLLGEYDGTGNLIEETVWMGDVPVAVVQPNGTGVSVYYVHTDHLNTPRRISRPTDNVIVWRWDSEPFGNSAANQDPDGDGTIFVYNLRFPGQYYDAETGLAYNYSRDYDPGTGRYVESDPIGLVGGINTYAYVGGNPLSRIDPYGLTSVEEAIAEAIARADVEALETLLEAADANQAKLIRAGLQRLNSTADQIISRECKASIRGRFPKSVLQNTLKEINELAQSGDKDAQTAWKLLTNNRFKK